MSTSTIDTVTENQAAAQQQKQKKQGQSSNSELFATLVQGQVPQNIVFTRVDRQLDVPKAGKVDTGDTQTTPFRDERAQNSTDPVEKYDTDITRDTAPVGRQEPTQTTRRDTNTGETAAAADQGAAQQTDSAQKPTDTNDNNNAAEASAGQANATANNTPGTDVQRFAAEVTVAKTANPTAARQTANANVETNGQVQTQLAGQDPNLAQKAAGQARGNVKVSEQAVAKPASTLAANTATTVQAEAGTQHVTPQQVTETRATATQLANAASDQEILKPEQANAGKVKVAASTNGNEKKAQANDGAQAQNNNAAAQSQTAQNFAALTATAANAAQSAASGAANSGQVAGPLTADPVSGAVPAQQAQTSAAARASAKTAASARPNVPPQVVAEQVAVNINRAAGQGLDRITIQMRPAELGRVDVKMEVAHDGRLTAVISVEKQETYDMLRADSRALTQALQDAGLQADQNSLSFNLKGQGNDFAGSGSNNGNSGSGEGSSFEDGLAEADDDLLALGETAQPDADGRYDVRV